MKPLNHKINNNGIKVNKDFNKDLVEPSILVSEMNQVWTNLIDNAIRNTPENGEVVVELVSKNQTVYVTFSDTGKGIAAEDLPQIFERFYRCDPSRSQAGTGLGLSFARTVARAHGGDITVNSVPNQGSTFSVTLPVGASNK